jgi:hypothetical protein
MTSGFVPLAGPGLAPAPASATRSRRASRRAGAAKAAEGRALHVCVLAFAVLVELALAAFPQALLLAPWQASAGFRMASGYPMLALLAFSVAFGWLRRRPTLARSHRRLSEVHQLGGLVLLVLLALHAGGRPAGFLLYTLHAMSVALAAGAIRGALGPRLGRRGSLVLLTLHISLACVLAVAALVHLYFVYAYTA